MDKPIIYDPAGNPISYRGATLSWEHGRQLASYSKGGESLSFEYDYAGIRTKKVAPYNNGSRTTYYYLEGSRIIAEKIGVKSPIWYYYDATGICGMKYKINPNNSNPDEYYFEKNILGDVVAIWNSNGTLQGRYTYDAWGNILSVTDAQGNDIDPSDEYSIMNLNPFRYRGYYYDKETNLYYLNSRYYDPETGRFINADDPSVLFETATMPFGVNLFAYCNDNPVMMIDSTGHAWEWNTFWTGLVMVLTASAAIALSVTTFGAGIPLGMTIVADVTLGAGVLTGINGVATMIEAGTQYNFVRDGVFNGLGWSDSAYNIYAGITEGVAVVGSMVLGFYHTTGQYKAAKASQQYLGKGYTKEGKNRWVSQDRLRQVRWDTTHHMYKGKPSPLHFNWYEYSSPIRAGIRNKAIKDIHVWLKLFSYYI